MSAIDESIPYSTITYTAEKFGYMQTVQTKLMQDNLALSELVMREAESQVAKALEAAGAVPVTPLEGPSFVAVFVVRTPIRRKWWQWLLRRRKAWMTEYHYEDGWHKGAEMHQCRWSVLAVKCPPEHVEAVQRGFQKSQTKIELYTTSPRDWLRP